MISSIFVQHIKWNGITVEVTYEPEWMRSVSEHLGAPLAHLQIRSVQPERAALPISETGYKSRFVGAAYVVEQGGPGAYAIAWLDEAACSPEWRNDVEAARQLAFF